MEIRPFRGWRYRPVRGKDISPFLAPPYDVLSAQDKQELLARSDKNIVAVDMPYVPPKELGPDEVYQEAARRLEQWKADGVLVQDSAPCVYLYEQTYQWAGRTCVRTALIAGVRATAFGQDVMPHEHTFAGPKADRLKLMQLTRMQLSPIFGFYRDDTGQVVEIVKDVTRTEPTAQGELRGVTEKVWALNKGAALRKLGDLLAVKKVYIADGHHRYTTAMNYRDQLLAEGRIDSEHEANFVQFALVSRDDPGMRILPTHRILRGLTSDFSLGKLIQATPEFCWRRCNFREADLADADAFLAPYGQAAMAFIESKPTELWVARLEKPEAMREAAPDQLQAWRELDVAILHKLIIDKAMAPWRTEQTGIEYTPDGTLVASTMKQGKAQLGVCLQATALESVQTIADAGAVMPHKSTYFYPKLATGIVLKPIE